MPHFNLKGGYDMKLEEIKDIFDANGMVLEQTATYLNNTPCLINKEQMEQITGGDKALDQSSFALFLSNLFFENQDLASFVYREYYSRGVKKLSPQTYQSDPYYKSIKIPQAQIGTWTLKNQTYAPYEAFIFDDLKINGYKEIPQIGFFDTEFTFPTVFENGVEWMAIKPNEIETMKKPIADAFGNVLVCGLGLGYYAYMISNKSSVDSITIIERDKRVISLFEKYILPQFENKHKITIVNDDAIKYLMEKAPKRAYDFIFVDLWHDASDGVELYIRVKKLETLNKGSEFSYWIERTLISSIRFNIFNALYPKLKSGEIFKTENELEQMLSDSYIRELAKHL